MFSIPTENRTTHPLRASQPKTEHRRRYAPPNQKPHTASVMRLATEHRKPQTLCASPPKTEHRRRYAPPHRKPNTADVTRLPTENRETLNIFFFAEQLLFHYFCENYPIFMNILTLTANPFQVNTYIVYNSDKQAIIIDPACSNPEEQNYFIREIDKHGLTPAMILLTHGHIDHILGCGFMREHYKIPVFAHEFTEIFIAQAESSADLFGLHLSHPPVIDKFIEHEQTIGIDQISFKAFHTPGHASGSLCFYSETSELVFSGDVLFQQSIGRTDLPTGDMDVLLFHIRKYLLTLPPQTIVYPGHGPKTTIENEIHTNPFL